MHLEGSTCRPIFVVVVFVVSDFYVCYFSFMRRVLSSLGHDQWWQEKEVLKTLLARTWKASHADLVLLLLSFQMVPSVAATRPA